MVKELSIFLMEMSTKVSMKMEIFTEKVDIVGKIRLHMLVTSEWDIWRVKDCGDPKKIATKVNIIGI